MIQGEPLEETPAKDADSAELPAMGPVMHAPAADRSKVPVKDADHAFRPAESADAKTDDKAMDTLDADVEQLVSALADAESERDADWIETEQEDDMAETSEKSSLFDDRIENETGSADEESKRPAVALFDDVDAFDAGDLQDEARESLSGKKQETDELIDAVLATSTDAPSEMPAPDASAAGEAIHQATEPTVKADDESPNLLGLQAINVLNEKITSSETRYDDALTKIGHALGLIAERIDGLEARMTDQKMSSVAFAAPAPMMDEPPIDDSVAPYIARAERELKARKESGSMDIFDRIAKAAESEFDGQASGTETRIIENPGDGRRVGTKRWQPSKTVKRRMEQLEQARDGVVGAEDASSEPKEPAARNLRTDIDAITAATAAAPAAAAQSGVQAGTAPEPLDLDDEEEDDSGLSVVPGVRGRRRHRARKSRLDEDFENVFVEDEEKPSIQSLRRKMRDRPAEEPEEPETKKGSMLGNILGKKTAKKVVPVEIDEDEDDDEDLMAAFDAPELREEKTARKGTKARKLDEIDEIEDDEIDEGGARFAGSPLLYVLIAGVAAAGFFLWKTFIA